MNCSNCGAALSVGTEIHLLNCEFCGTTQRNPNAAERRPIDDLLDKVFAETGDGAFEVRVETTEIAATSTICEVEGRRYASLDPAPPDVKQALRDTNQALDEIFGDDVVNAVAVETVVAESVVDEDVASESEAEPELEPPVSPQAVAAPVVDFQEPAADPRRPRPQIVLGGHVRENPDWTRYLVPFLVLALLGGLGVAGLTALILG